MPFGKKSSHPLIWRVLLIGCGIIFAGIVVALLGRTLISASDLIFACALLGILTAIIIDRVSGGDWNIHRYVRLGATLIIATELYALGFLSANMLFPISTDIRTEKAVVRSVYSETHHRTRRVGRRYIANGEEYKIYKMDVEFSNGCIKSRAISSKRYNRIHQGDSIEFQLETGLFGIPFIASDRN